MSRHIVVPRPISQATHPDLPLYAINAMPRPTNTKAARAGMTPLMSAPRPAAAFDDVAAAEVPLVVVPEALTAPLAAPDDPTGCDVVLVTGEADPVAVPIEAWKKVDAADVI